jgi:hypothetical protein
MLSGLNSSCIVLSLSPDNSLLRDLFQKTGPWRVFRWNRFDDAAGKTWKGDAFMSCVWIS